jgi:hypothetical protein
MPQPANETEQYHEWVEGICWKLGLSADRPSDPEVLRQFLRARVNEARVAKTARALGMLVNLEGMAPNVVGEAIRNKLRDVQLENWLANEFAGFQEKVALGTIAYHVVVAKIYEALGCDSTIAAELAKNHTYSVPLSLSMRRARHGTASGPVTSGRVPPGPTKAQRRDPRYVNMFDPKVQPTGRYSTPAEPSTPFTPPYSPSSRSAPFAPTPYPPQPVKPLARPGESDRDPPLDSAEQDALAAPVATGAWRYEEQTQVPGTQPLEYVSEALTDSTSHVALGARVRGKKHKHDGRGCDDWFEMGVAGAWTILAVADGAGSREFSRLGAEYACKAAREYLQQELQKFQIEALTPDAWARDPDWCFVGRELKELQLLLYESFRQAHAEMKRAADNRADTDHQAILGRPPTVEDFACTLLVAIHTVAQGDGGPLDLVLACQVGDGIAAAISAGGSLVLLGEAARGDHAGETAFISDPRRVDAASLRTRTQVFVGKLRALMLMTDGVADDYFPNDPDLLRLYADLVLNGIVQLRVDDEIAPSAESTRPVWVDEVERLVGKEMRDKVQIRSAEKYLAGTGMSPADLIKSPVELAALAVAARLDPPMIPSSPAEPLTPEKRLEIWLDSYHVRGSFDDRALVVFHPTADLGNTRHDAAGGGGDAT